LILLCNLRALIVYRDGVVLILALRLRVYDSVVVVVVVVVVAAAE